MRKYRNKKVIVDNITFDSIAESRRYLELNTLFMCGTIVDLVLQPQFILAESCIIKGRKKPPLRYKADFSYKKDGIVIVEDVKGMLTKEYIIKRHLMKTVHGIDIVEIKK